MPGDRVTIVTPHGQTRTGRAVMKGPYGWVLNMGGPHGTPAVATDRNIVRVVRKGKRNTIMVWRRRLRIPIPVPRAARPRNSIR